MKRRILQLNRYMQTQPAKNTCFATVFQGANKGFTFEQLPEPTLEADTDAIVKVLKTTICGTDLHILSGNVETCPPFQRLGHEGIGVITEVGSAVSKYKIGDRILVSCITNCGKCAACQKKFFGHCEDGGWVLGNTIGGMQTEYARIPHVDTSCYLAIMVDVNQHRLDVAKDMGASHVVDNSNGDAVEQILELTNGEGVDLIVEAIGTPPGWYICQDAVKSGGRIAMLGVDGKSATINLEKMWYRNFSFTAGLVHGYTTAQLMNGIMDGKIGANKLISHEIPLSQIEKAYDMFQNAGTHATLKILLVNDL